jgi:hypothetical protein
MTEIDWGDDSAERLLCLNKKRNGERDFHFSTI